MRQTEVKNASISEVTEYTLPVKWLLGHHINFNMAESKIYRHHSDLPAENITLYIHVKSLKVQHINLKLTNLNYEYKHNT